MRLLLLTLLLTTSNLLAQTSKPGANPSKEVVQYLDKLQQLLKKNSLFADSVNWNQLHHEVAEQAQGLVTVAQCRPVIDHILGTLRNAGDKHSYFIPKEKAASQLSSDYKGQQAESRYLENGIGYIKVPEFVSMNPSVGLAFAQRIQSQLEALETQHHPTGWVVDLRHNTGGNMHPMLDGLQVLIGTGTYGYFIYPQYKREIPLQIRSDNKKGQQAGQAATTPRRVAVLIDSLTASSGEMVAMSLKGLHHTKFFGQPSAGYTTINRDFQLSDGAYLLLATGYMADRNRHTYPHGIAPDVVVKYSPDNAPDKTIEAASKWLREAE